TLTLCTSWFVRGVAGSCLRPPEESTRPEDEDGRHHDKNEGDRPTRRNKQPKGVNEADEKRSEYGARHAAATADHHDPEGVDHGAERRGRRKGHDRAQQHSAEGGQKGAERKDSRVDVGDRNANRGRDLRVLCRRADYTARDRTHHEDPD